VDLQGEIALLYRVVRLSQAVPGRGEMEADEGLRAIRKVRSCLVTGGVQRGFAPLLGVWGYPPTSNFPQEWRIKGVDEGFLNALKIRR
jgi:hypothetical protein